MKDIIKRYFTTVFPEELCTRKDPREKGIKDSDELFQCVIVDSRFPTEYRIQNLCPYTCPAEKRGQHRLYGWYSPDENGQYYDNWERDIHDDDARVIAWRKLKK